MPQLTGRIVTLGPLERRHLEPWRAWVNDPEIAGYLDRVLPVTAFEHEAFFETHVAGNSRAVWFAVENVETRRYIGNAWLWNIEARHRHAELRILIGDRSSWGTGSGSEAISLLVRYAFENLGLHKVYAHVMHRNPRARKAFHKAGFVDEATFRDEVFWEGRFEDVWRVMQLRKASTA